MSVFVWRELYDLAPEPLYPHFAFAAFTPLPGLRCGAGAVLNHE